MLQSKYFDSALIMEKLFVLEAKNECRSRLSSLSSIPVMSDFPLEFSILSCFSTTPVTC